VKQDTLSRLDGRAVQWCSGGNASLLQKRVSQMIDTYCGELFDRETRKVYDLLAK